MKTLEYTVRFTTPAFLGNAEQSAQWRTPPFKALLRQWWRVVYAAEHRFQIDVAKLRHDEGVLFGHAWLENDTFERDGRQVTTAARKSAVRLRLDRWDDGKLASSQWQALATTSHPEVRQAVASDLYLGYGPVTLPRGAQRATLKANAAIQAGECAQLSVAVPETQALRIERALWLMARFGTLGGRSRNGWGSFALFPVSPGEGQGVRELPLRDWQQCLDRDWPHAIGRDGKGPLIWTTAPQDDWKVLMKTLAVIKIGLRTQFVFPNAQPPHQQALPRHWLSYPITRHTTKAFDRNARLPNSLRFKVRATDDGRLVGVVFHVPCLPPAAFAPDRTAIIATWQRVHGLLDELTQSVAARRYPTITDADRRAVLKAGLDGVALQRIAE
jgi:CRISPR-associated protein Cmr1